MAEPRTRSPAFGALSYAALLLAVMFARLLPLDTTPQTWPRPDYMVAITLAFAARRPAMLPVWLVAALFLLADFLFQQPPGLWALVMVLTSEALRARAESLRAASLWAEWASVAAFTALAFFAARLLHGLLFTPPPPLLPYLGMGLLTILIYPIVAEFLSLTLGLRRRAPGALDERGRKL